MSALGRKQTFPLNRALAESFSMRSKVAWASPADSHFPGSSSTTAMRIGLKTRADRGSATAITDQQSIGSGYSYLSRDAARRIASNIAKLPDLISRKSEGTD